MTISAHQFLGVIVIIPHSLVFDAVNNSQSLGPVDRLADQLNELLGFLKDPLVANDVLHRIEAMGFVLGDRRFLFAPLDTVQIAYLSALAVRGDR